jgi:hypothetical protein
VIGLPPLFTGAVKVAEADPSPGAAAALVGALGTVAGTTAFEAAEATPVPAAFVAFTVHV